MESLRRFRNTIQVAPPSMSTAPALYSAPRFTSLVASLLVALCAGTNYAFSAYSPQLGARLRVSHTKLNLIGLAGNLGVYGSGPLWGRLVDKTGPRLAMLSAWLLLLVGYSGIRGFYDAAENSSTSIPTFSFCILMLCSVASGAGGNAGFTGSINSTAKSFPDRLRATTTGIVLSGFGLSAFLFSTLASYAFPGDTSAFLLVLALGTSTPMLIGLYFVRAIPLPPSEQHHHDHDPSDPARERLLAPSEPRQERLSSTTPLLTEDEADIPASSLPETPATEFIPEAAAGLELARTQSRHRTTSRISDNTFSPSHRHPPLIDISGRKLWTNLDFLLGFTLLSILSGTGLMYINNVGSMSQALFAQGKDEYNEVKASKWQATQVSIISVFNFAGRILIGLLSDATKNSLGYPRSYCLMLVSLLMLASQFIAMSVDSVETLWQASTALGLAYGATFGIFPTLTLGWFGMGHFSENWGFMSLSPMIGGNLFSMVFGKTLDAHETPSTTNSVNESHAPSTSSPNHITKNLCQSGRACYIDALSLTIGACVIALLLSAIIGWRDRRKTLLLSAEEIKESRTIPVWADDDDEAQ